MATLLRVPEVVAGATDVVLSEWLVGTNVPFRAGDSIAVVETEKANVEVPAESDGIILRTLVAGGNTVAVGAPLAWIGAEGESGAELEDPLDDAGPEPEPAASTSGDMERRRVFMSPLARRLLTEAGLATDDVEGTGPNGRVLRRDVERAVEAAHPAPVETPAVQPQQPPGAAAGARSRVIPHTRLRRAVADRLTASKQTIPHFYLKRTARVDSLLDLRAQLNAVSDTTISVNDLVIRAVAVAHQSVPDANVIWTEEGMRQFESVDVAVAVASTRGLVTPVLRSVERTTPSAVASQVKAYVAQAAEGTLRQHDLEGGSITVTNLGMHGVEEFAAIINPPHASILAVGAARQEPVAVDGAVRVATQLTLVLSVDHRAMDGVLAAKWLSTLVHALEHPLRLLA